MTTLIGITEERLQELVEQAAMNGYERGRSEALAGDILDSRDAILRFLSPSKPISVATFNRNRAKGVYGTAVTGTGRQCHARKGELLDAISKYESLNF